MKVALVISIEDYADPALNLPGSHADALAFIEAVESFGPLDDLVWCAANKTPRSTHGATRRDILDALRDKVTIDDDGWQGKKVELFAYVSGHGVVIPGRDGAALEALITAGWTGPASGEVIALGELLTRLQNGLGNGVHHWFYDVCRIPKRVTAEPLDDDIFGTEDFGFAFPSQVWATARGKVAANQSGFGPAVAAALRGDARRWSDGKGADRRLVVLNPVVARYAEAAVQLRFPEQTVGDHGGRHQDVLRMFEDPQPKRKIVVRGDGAVTLVPGRGGVKPVEIAGKGERIVEVVVDDYAVEPADDFVADPTGINLLLLGDPPPIDVSPPSGLESFIPRRALISSDPFGETKRTDMGKRWLAATNLDKEKEPHLSEALHDIPVDMTDAGDGVTLAAVAGVLGNNFEVLDRGGFSCPARQPGVYVVLSAVGMARGMAFAELYGPRGGNPLGPEVPLDDHGTAVAVWAFLPLHTTTSACRLVIRTADGYRRAILIPVGPDAVTVVHCIDHAQHADQRVAMVPVHVPPHIGMKMAGRQIVAQASGRGDSTERLPSPSDEPPRIAAFYGALVRAAVRGGAEADPGPAEPDPVWLASWWDSRSSKDPLLMGLTPNLGDQALKDLGAKEVTRTWRSPLTTWRLRAAGA